MEYIKIKKDRTSAKFYIPDLIFRIPRLVFRFFLFYLFFCFIIDKYINYDKLFRYVKRHNLLAFCAKN